MTPDPSRSFRKRNGAQRSGSASSGGAIIPALVLKATDDEYEFARYWASARLNIEPLCEELVKLRAQATRDRMIEDAKLMCEMCRDMHPPKQDDDGDWEHFDYSDSHYGYCDAADFWQALAAHDAAMKKQASAQNGPEEKEKTDEQG